jgi:hypothetical protein
MNVLGVLLAVKEEDIADAAVLFCSNHARWITGQCRRVLNSRAKGAAVDRHSLRISRHDGESRALLRAPKMVR